MLNERASDKMFGKVLSEEGGEGDGENHGGGEIEERADQGVFAMRESG